MSARVIAAIRLHRRLFSIFLLQGIVNDPRNTDNAWIETVAVNYHDNSSGNTFQKVALRAGDEVTAARWVQVHKGLELYASHKEILEKVPLGRLTVMHAHVLTRMCVVSHAGCCASQRVLC